MLLAKSENLETLREHTQRLLTNYHLLRETYPHICSPRTWELLKLAVLYHDTGKAYTPFQNMIRKATNQKQIETSITYEIPHNYLSVLFVPIDQLKQEMGLTLLEEKALLQAIAYHHERKKEIDSEKIKEAVEKDLYQQISVLEQELEIPINKRLGTKYFRSVKKRIQSADPAYPLYIQLKGLLHRLDHAASAHTEVEFHGPYSVAQYTKASVEKNSSLRPLQTFALQNQDQNLIIIAQTGMGKTEAALLWIGEEKAFFTLPLRVSINELYKRTVDLDRIGFVDEQGIPIAGLLHSSALDYLEKQAKDHDVSEQEEQSSNDFERAYLQSQLLSRKLTFSTIDQILKFPLLFKGYEKWYATLAYSKVVIDEIQAYSPKIIAVILKALEMIHQAGGKFMIMTATLPGFILDTLDERVQMGIGTITQNDYQMKKFTTERIRHRLSVRKKGLLEDLPIITQKATNKKVLVICNTVKRAVEVYQQFQDIGVQANLLHSQFTMEDRFLLEDQITKFAKNSTDRDDTPGIWITTQIVEASIDVDFDVLYTELSVLDSLFQRMGRCYRNREIDHDQPNIFVYIEDVSGIGSVYDRDLFQFSKSNLLSYDGKTLTEDQKMQMVQEIYVKEKLQGTKYYEVFQKTLQNLDTMEPYELSSNEAQDIMREIYSITVIPRNLFDELIDDFERYNELRLQERVAKSIGDPEKLQRLRKEKRRIRKKIENKSISISYQFYEKHHFSKVPYKGFDYLYILNQPYDFDPVTLTGQGIVWEKEEELFII